MLIFAAREEDAHQGWVWLQDPALRARGVVKITNPATRRSVYCETLQIESNFLNQYNQPPRFSITDPKNTLVIGAWHRAALGGIMTQTDTPLKVEPSNLWWGHYKASVDHPQVVVRLATRLGAIGFILGLIGLCLGIASLC